MSEEKNQNLKWYIVQSYAGQEKTVANNIKQRIKANNLEDKMPEVLVPTKEKVVVKSGKKKKVEEKIFPGYILIQMEMNDNTSRVVKNTQGVTGFVGTNRKPTPLNEKKVKGIMAYMEVKQPSFQTSFEVNDAVKVTDGPFKDFMGTISEINPDKGQVKVLLTVFGRETPIVLDFLQVTKL
ncbi:transcription termination/antitermination factor NusG [Candidatus Dojkabacteria bacterium]|nr:transcription termination/antitermination factor NusG [Candidatus Dojkabacteria bacterium]